MFYKLMTDFQQNFASAIIGVRDKIFEWGATPPAMPPNLAIQRKSHYQICQEEFDFVLPKPGTSDSAPDESLHRPDK